MQWISLFFIMVSFSVYSQKKDTMYVKTFSHKINIKTSLEIEEQSLEVTNLNTLDKYSLRQNEVGKLALSLNYNIVGLKVGFSPDFLKNDTYLKGSAKYRHYRLQVFLPKIYQQFYYYNTKGFYIRNTEDYVENWEQGKHPYLQIPNLNTIEFGGETRYYFSNKFGYRAIFSNTELQLKSKGTWLMALKYYYSNIEKTSNEYFVLNDKSYHLNIIGGYAYNLIFNKNYYAFGQVTPNLGFKYVKNLHDKTSGGTENNKYIIPNVGLRARFGLGYNSNRFYWGASVLLNALSYSEYANIDLVDTRLYASIHLGYRFKAFKTLENLFKKMGL